MIINQASVDQTFGTHSYLLVSCLQIVLQSTAVVEVPSSLPSTRLTAAEQPSQLIETLNSCVWTWIEMIN